MWMDYGSYRGWTVKSDFNGQAVALKGEERIAVSNDDPDDEKAINDIENKIDEIEDSAK